MSEETADPEPQMRPLCECVGELVLWGSAILRPVARSHNRVGHCRVLCRSASAPPLSSMEPGWVSRLSKCSAVLA